MRTTQIRLDLVLDSFEVAALDLFDRCVAALGLPGGDEARQLAARTTRDRVGQIWEAGFEVEIGQVVTLDRVLPLLVKILRPEALALDAQGQEMGRHVEAIRANARPSDPVITLQRYTGRRALLLDSPLTIAEVAALAEISAPSVQSRIRTLGITLERTGGASGIAGLLRAKDARRVLDWKGGK